MDELEIKTIYTKRVPIYKDEEIIRYFPNSVSCLTYHNHRITNYYSDIKSLKIDDYYKVAYYISCDHKILTRYKVIKLKRDENNNVIPLAEEVVINDLYRYIYYGGKDTIIVEKDGLFSYIELNSQSPYYLKPLFPFSFTMASAFGLEFSYFANVNIDFNRGYIFRIDEPIKELDSKNLFTKEEAEYLEGLLSHADQTAKEKLSHYSPKLTLHL